VRSATDCESRLLLNCPLQTYHQNGFAHASDDTGTLFIDYCFLRCSRLRMTDPSQFIKAAWIRPEDLAVYEAMGTRPSSFWNGGFRRRNCCGASKPTASGGSMEIWPNCCCRMASSNRSARNRSGVCVTSGSRQASPRRLKPLLDLARLQGWLSPLPECPIRVDARQIPENFLDGFRDRDCASMDCQACGYCERIAARAVSISPGYAPRC